MKKTFVFLVFIIFLAGCSDYNELSMQELVRNVGVDAENGEVFVCVACEGEEKGETIIKKSKGKSFFEAVRKISEKSDKKLYWGHLQSVVFGEGAQTTRFDETLDAFSRARDVYSDILLVGAIGISAEEVVASAEAPLGAFSNEKNSGHFEEMPMWRFFRQKELFGVSEIPVITKVSDALTLSGGLLLAENGERHRVSGEEALLIGLLTTDGGGGYLPTISKPPAKEISFEILANEVTRRKAEGVFEIIQKITLAPAEVKGNTDVGQMKKEAEEYLSEGYKKLLLRMKKEGFENALMLRDMKGDIKIRTEVTISNVFGGE